MRVRDIMTYNVVTVPSDTPVSQAAGIMRAHRFERLPIVDKGKLVGLVTKDRVLRAAPSSATSLSIWELTYLLSKMTVKEIMEKDVITATPDMTVESAVALAQERRVGCLLVLEGDRVVGIVTTNDFFYKILNPLLGIGEVGTRLTVRSCDVRCMTEVLGILNRHKADMKTMMYLPSASGEEKDLVLHVDIEAGEANKIMDDVKASGYTAEVRER